MAGNEKKNEIKNEKKNDKYSAVRNVLRRYSSIDKPMKQNDIQKKLDDEGYTIKRHAIATALDDMGVVEIENDSEYIEARDIYMEKGERIYCRVTNGRRTNYWIEGAITDAELGLLVDMVLSSKILTYEESQSLAMRIINLSGKELDDALKYRCRVMMQPYVAKDKKKKDIKNHQVAISEVAQRAYLIRRAMKEQKKVRFTLNVYDYNCGKVCLKQCGKKERTCSPYDLTMSNGRYYMLGAEAETEQSETIRYKLYRVDLMTDLSITKIEAKTAKDAGISDEIYDISKFRRENPFMFVGEKRHVRFRIERDYFTQVVDWFGSDFNVIQDKETDDKYLTIDVFVSTNSFIYWVLQYGNCTEVVEKKGDNCFRETVKLRLNEILQKYLESDRQKKENESK